MSIQSQIESRERAERRAEVASASGAVFWFSARSGPCATRLLVFPTSIDLARYVGYRRSDPLIANFRKRYRFARAGNGRPLLGELRLCADLLDLNWVVWTVYQQVDFARRNGYASEAECPAILSQLVGAVCRECRHLRFKLPLHRDELPYVMKVLRDGNTRFVLRADLACHEHSVRLLLNGDAAPDLELSGFGPVVAEVKLHRRSTREDLIAQAYQAVERLRSVERRATDDNGARLCGQLVAAIAEHTQPLGFRLRPGPTPLVQRVWDRWTPLLP